MQNKKYLASQEKIDETINALNLYRSGWANDIREAWQYAMPGALPLIFKLYALSGCIVLSLMQIKDGFYRDKMAMMMVRKQLEDLVKSKEFDDFSALSEAGMCQVVTTGTRHHIRVMFEVLEELTA